MKRSRAQAGLTNKGKKGNQKRRRVTTTRSDTEGMQFDGTPSTVIRSNNLSAVPRTMNLKLKFGDMHHLTDASSTHYHAFRANSLYDPDYTGVGNQPRGFDQWAAFYQFYRVNAVRVEATFMNTAAGGSNISTPKMISLIAGTGLSASGYTIQDILEEPQCSYDYLSVAYGESIKKLKMYIPMHKLFGITKKEYTSEDSYNASVDANPARSAFVQYLMKYDNSLIGTPLTNVRVFINMTYYVTFHQPKSLNQS